ncbi:LPXTG cell wall anchor domain-containing protein [Listeria newyorkensis]|uniref:LPXTG cell wall anchor domain-containing protein n=1 Tax=Listeria newyorkensis TaxID=1497681 RepID=UPI001BB21766|nr:LPXTG cell wall anchor domain-containing protein [Listeria newyorkensis]
MSGELAKDTVYTITPLNDWATATNVTLGEAATAPGVTAPDKQPDKGVIVTPEKGNNNKPTPPAVTDSQNTPSVTDTQATKSENANDLPKTGDTMPIIPMTAGLGAILTAVYMLLKRKFTKLED